MFKTIPQQVIDFMDSAPSHMVQISKSDSIDYINEMNADPDRDGEPYLVERIAKEVPGARKHSFSYLAADLDNSGELIISYGTARTDGDKRINPNKNIDEQLSELKTHLEKEYGVVFRNPEVEAPDDGLDI